MNKLQHRLVTAVAVAASTTFAQADTVSAGERLVRQYLSAWDARDVNAMLRTLAPDAVVIVPQQEPIVGRERIRPLLEHFVADFSQPGSTFTFDDLHAHGAVASFRWSGQTPTTSYSHGSNTCVVRNGRIAYLTVALEAAPNAKGAVSAADGSGRTPAPAADR